MTKQCRLISLMITLVVGSFTAAHGQNFKLMRFDEDYSSWKDSVPTFYQSLKYLRLNKNGDAYLSLGGEVRLEGVAFRNEDWGRLGIGQNNFLLQRYNLHADWHIDQRFRVFVQLRSALENGRKNGARSIDQDALNIQNLFLDWKAIAKKGQSLTLRFGRQEIDYGSGRLLSVQEIPNVRLAFTGVKAMYSSSKLSLDGFALTADTINLGVFDNKIGKEINLWGAYAKINLVEKSNLELYYLGINRSAAKFEQGIGKEKRHTLGSRFSRTGLGFIYNFEAVYQFGSFAQNKIRAWTASTELGYAFSSKLKPVLYLRNDYVSGDTDAGDGKLQTFNPLYPRGGYFGFNPQIGPVNLIDLHPSFSIAPGKRFVLQGDAVFYWRYSSADGIYRPSGTFNLSGANATQKYAGTAYLINGIYTFNKFLSLNTGIQYFDTGPFVDEIIPNSKNGLFINSRVTLKL